MTKRIARGRKVSDAEKKLTYDLTYKDVVDLLEIIDRSACRELHLELEDFTLTVVKKSENPSVKSSEETKDLKKGK